MERRCVIAVLLLALVACSAGAERLTKETLTAIFERKSVRQYTGELAKRDDLDMLVKAGMAAPTAMDRMPWAFVIVTDKPTLQRLANGLPYSKMIVPAGSAIVVCGVMSKTIPGRDGEVWIQDCSAATENILLAAESMGLGAVWIGIYPSMERAAHVRNVLGIPQDVVPLNVIAVGLPIGTEHARDKYDAANIHRDRW